jgi:nucleoside-diphosphate-sugar epimerase
MRKAVITGGAGFIGSHIVEELINNQFRVIVLDSVPREQALNIKSAIENRNLDYVQGDVDNLASLIHLFSGVDYVFHLAAAPYTTADAQNSVAYYQANSKGILNVLQAARDSHVKKVIYASSSAIYGNDPTLPKREDMIPNPLSPYAVTKLVAETYCGIYQRQFGLSTVCLRYFNVYGPRQSADSQLASVIPRFIRNVQQGMPPVIFGDGNQTRDFVFIKDVARANRLVAESNTTGIFNIGTGREVSLNQVAQIVLLLVGQIDLGIKYEVERTRDIKYSVADMTRSSTFGFTPKYSIERGLQLTIKWHQSNQTKND